MNRRKKRLNVAYGSNLHLDQMKWRCPTARVYGKGTLKGYRLLFQGSPGNAYCTIEPYEGGEVPVLVWDVKERDEAALDRYEGYPNFYDKVDVEVELDTGKTVTAFVYVMTDKIHGRTELNFPSERYLETVVAGYDTAGFDIRYLQHALQESDKAISRQL